ncbi:hypothetical protein LIER_12823 [Lithospermum erythrorhizon]|uniref:Uncharacterized protein n=1 Tax=Lithospermum erythrorhizon TaxID=34254 RepID=A0AAV3PV24_LITER
MQNIKINMPGIPKSKFMSLLLSVPTLFLILYLIISLPYILEILSFISPVFVIVYILLIAFFPIVTKQNFYKMFQERVPVFATCLLCSSGNISSRD